MKTNVKTKSVPLYTHEGAVAVRDSTESQLRRSVLSCLLWENSFYEGGEDIATRIQNLASKVEPKKVAALAIEARHVFHLRHVPLLLLIVLGKTGSGIPHLVANTVERVITRADELSELVSLYWKINGKKVSLPNQFKKGLARAFTKFDQYQLTKYNRDGAVKLRDVAFLTHPKAKDADQALLWSMFLDKESVKHLASPDTWEVELSKGADKKETFERLLHEGKLGYLALLRNLRNMEQSGVDRDLVISAIYARKGAHNVLPFRFIAAARYAPSFEYYINEALIASLNNLPKFTGSTGILVDVSGSMDYPLSVKSDMKRIDVAAALASVFPGYDVREFSFSHDVVEVPRRLGIPGVESVINSQPHGGTNLGAAIQRMNRYNFDRLIVISDEQSSDHVGDCNARLAYMINVGGYQNSVVSQKNWIKIGGFSENILRYIYEYENMIEESVMSVKQALDLVEAGDYESSLLS